jgi:hypothetical protein
MAYGVAREDGKGGQVIEVTVEHGYRPQSIRARAHVPLRVVFRRRDDEECLERIVFSSPNWERRLAPLAETAVVLPPQPPGVVRFTCAMGRYRGQIEFVSEPSRSALGRLRGAASWPEDGLVLAGLVALCALPLVAILSVLVLDGSAVVPAALLALVVLAVACFWAIRQARRIQGS